MKNIIYGICFLPFLVFAQQEQSSDSTVVNNKKKREKSQNESVLTIDEYEASIFYLVHQSWAANQDLSTASLLSNFVIPADNRRVEMRDGEGEDQWYLLEAKLNLSYPLISGRKEYGSVLRKLNRLNFDYGVNFRMLFDTSSPVTPPSQKVGISWNVNLYNNYSQCWLSGWSQDSSNPIYRYSKNKNLRFLNFKFQLHHYSNGQSGGVKYLEENSLEERNNYINGDFSTNYFSGQLTYGWYNTLQLNLNQISLKYRRDFGSATGEIAYFQEQVESYGYDRVSLKYDYRSTDNWWVPWHLRLETGLITDDLSKFKSNLNDTKKYRLNALAMFELTPKLHRAVGYFISVYYGRDYLNIRYDDIVYVIRAGLTLNLDNYKVNKAQNVRN